MPDWNLRCAVSSKAGAMVDLRRVRYTPGESLYYDDGNGCEEMVVHLRPNDVFYRLGPEIPLDSFVRMEETVLEFTGR